MRTFEQFNTKKLLPLNHIWKKSPEKLEIDKDAIKYFAKHGYIRTYLKGQTICVNKEELIEDLTEIVEEAPADFH